MSQGVVVLNLLQERIKNLDLLKDLLLQQQKALVASNAADVTHFAEMQVNCMENIQAIEAKWQKILDNVKVEKQVDTITSDYVISVSLPDDQSIKALAYLEKIKKNVQEIENIKRNNALLLNNSLSLVKTTLQQLQGDVPSASIYNPYRRPEQRHILLNKKL